MTGPGTATTEVGELTGPEHDQAERLRRLAERRSGASDPAAPPAPAPAEVRRTMVPTTANRGRHAAPAGRVLAAGLTASAFFGGYACMSANPPSWLHDSASSSTNPPTTLPVPAITVPPSTTAPPTTIVVQTRHHPVYVDQYGKPIDPDVVPGATPPRSSTNTTRAGGTAPVKGGGTTPSAPSAPAPAPASPPVTATPKPPPPPPAPPCSGSKC